MNRIETGSAPRVSVVIPAFNREHLVREAADSILAQTLEDLELLIVDDGSTDRTAEVVLAIDDPRVRLIRHVGNRGMAAARNTGLDAARGQYVANLDSDDHADPTRLAHQVAFLDAHPDHAMVGSWITYMEADGRPTKIVKRRPIGAAEVHVQLLFGGGMTAPTMTGRADVLRLYRYSESFRVRQDYDLLVRMAERYKIANVPKILHHHRRHPGQVTKTQVGRLAAATKQIMGYQLERLGVPFGPDDLDRHYVLPRLGNPKLERQGTALPADLAFLDWAEGWLRAIEAGNARQGIYDPRALGHMLGWLWIRAAWRVGCAQGIGAWRPFRRSPLSRLAAPAVVARLRRSVMQPRP